MDKATRGYLLLGSPLKTTKGRVWLAAILAVAAFLAFQGLRLESGMLSGDYTWLSYSTVGSILLYVTLSFLNRKRLMHGLQLGTVAFVTLFVSYIAIYLNTSSPISLLTVGFVEEFVKIIPVLLMVIFLPSVIRNRKDGMIYGAFAGAGFNLMEIAFYINKESGSSGEWFDTINTQATRFGVLGFDNHVIWTMFLGMTLGGVVVSKHHGVRRWLPFIFGYLLVAVLHSLYDMAGAAAFLIVSYFVISLITGRSVESLTVDASASSQAGTLEYNSLLLEGVLYSIVFIIIIVRRMISGAAEEQGTYREYLADEGPSVITQAERAALQGEGRWGLRRYEGMDKRTSKRIVRLQNRLAMGKQQLAAKPGTPDGAEVLEALRSEIAGLRAGALGRTPETV